MNKIHQALPPDKYGKRTYGPSQAAGSRVTKNSALTASGGGVTKKAEERPFDGMNNIVANLLLNMTRYEVMTLTLITIVDWYLQARESSSFELICWFFCHNFWTSLRSV